MKGKQIRTKSIVQLEFYSCLLRNKKVLYNDVSLPRIHQGSRWPQKEWEETFETQNALPKGLPRDKISMASEKKPGFCKRPQRAERTFWSFKLDIQGQIRWFCRSWFCCIKLTLSNYCRYMDNNEFCEGVLLLRLFIFYSKQCIVHA